jgi:hypothetical protein
MNWIMKLFRRTPRTERVELRLVPYCKADKLLADGWQLAPEEDHNRNIGQVFLELRRAESESGDV